MGFCVLAMKKKKQKWGTKLQQRMQIKVKPLSQTRDEKWVCGGGLQTSLQMRNINGAP